MTTKFCKTCGAPLSQKDAYTWECNYCHNTYSDNSVRQESEKLIKTLLSDQKIEKVANLRKNLYDAVNEKYTDSDEICCLCMEIKALLPDDFMAGFYYTANHGTPKEICEAIRNIDAAENINYVYGITGHIIKSMRSEYALPLQNLVERAYKNTNMQKFEELSTLISTEVERVNAGMYETAVPRSAFIAYSSRDMQKVEELVHYLESNGLDCFVAARNLRHGRGAVQNYEKALHEAIENCECVVFVSSRNSRSMECDALRVELKYIKTSDTLTAPPEYRKNYSAIPYKYKMNRVEYRIDNERTQPYAEKVVSEFFSGLEYACSPEEVVDRIYNFDDSITEDIPIASESVTTPTKTAATKICVSCGNECTEVAKFCGSCGGQEFVGNKTELELYRLKKQMAEQEKKIAEATKRNLELTNKLNSQPKTAPIQTVKTTPAQTTPPSKPDSLSPNEEYDVILKGVDPSKKLDAIKVVRMVTGFGLREAKEIVENTPKAVKTGISGNDAEKLIAELSEVGGVAEAITVGVTDSAPTAAVSISQSETYNVILKSISNARKLQAIKTLREITGLSLAEAKDIVENTPKTILEAVPGDRASKAITALKEADAVAEAVKVNGTSNTSATKSAAAPAKNSNSANARYNVYLLSFGPRKLDTIAVLRNHLGLGLAEAKTLCEKAPCFVAYDLSREDATAMQKALESAKAIANIQQAT